MLDKSLISGSNVAATVSDYITVLHQNQHNLTDSVKYSGLNSGSNNITHTDHLSVIRVWRSSDNGKNHSSKLIILPSRHTNAYEATRLCMEEFSIPVEDQHSYRLYHVCLMFIFLS